MASYIRAKRQTQTVFLYCDPSETVNHLTEKLGKILNKPADEIRLIVDKSPLDGPKTLVDAKLENDSVVYFVYKKGRDDWESGENS